MTILVTGATGHLGRLIIDALIERGVPAENIVGTGRSIEKAADLAERGVRIVAADYTDDAALDSAFAGVSTLVLVSGSEVGQRAIQHQSAIDAAVRAGVKRVVYTSVLGADTTPLILAPEHKATEEALHSSGLAITVLRNGWYTENYAQTVTQAIATGTIVTSASEGRVSSALRAEYAEAAAVVASTDGHDGAVYELSGDVAWSFDELAAAITALAGTQVSVDHLDPGTHLARLKAAGLDDGTAGFLVALDGDIRSGLLDATTGDLARLIGRPTATLEAGVRTLLN